jgi:hypothetical protein
MFFPFLFQNVFNETQASATNNLKVTIGVLKLAGRNETQNSETK